VARRDSRAKVSWCSPTASRSAGRSRCSPGSTSAGHAARRPPGIVILVLLAKAFGLYDRDEHVLRKGTLDEAPRVLNVVCLCALGLWLVDGAATEVLLGQRRLVVFIGVLLAFMLVARSSARRLVGRRSAPERCLVVGDAGKRAAPRRAPASGRHPRELVGRLPLDQRRAGDPGRRRSPASRRCSGR
jgi:hypothetical protein